MATIEFQGIVNVRDLGRIPVAGGRIVAPGLFYRGGSLAKATEQDLELLFGELGVSCVVDVRCGWELESKPDIIPDGIEYLYENMMVWAERYGHTYEDTKKIFKGRDSLCYLLV